MHPSTLVIGEKKAASDFICQLVCQLLCGKTGCFCQTCSLVYQRKHPSCVMIEPEEGYTLSHISSFLPLLYLTRSAQDPLFIICMNAHQMTPSVANRLLKPIEEPAPFVYFIFATHDAHLLTPTLLSRCTVKRISCSEKEEDELLTKLCAPQDLMIPFLSKGSFHHDKVQTCIEKAKHLLLKETEEKELTPSCMLEPLETLPPVPSGGGTIFAKYLSCSLSPLLKK